MDGWRAGQIERAPGLDVPALHGRACYAGIDLASKIDLCALSLVFPPTDDDPKWYWVQQIWTPEDTIKDRSHRDRVPYDLWADQGWIQTTPGTRVDHNRVVDALVVARGLYVLRGVGFDPWHADKLIDDLVHVHGFDAKQAIEIPQTFKGLSSASLRVQADILAGLVDAGGCPVTARAVSNAVAGRDGKDNLQFVKGKSTGRIDPLVSATIGVAVCLKEPPDPGGGVEAWVI